MADPDTATAVGSNILSTTDRGSTWGRRASGVPKLLSGVWFTDANTGTVVGGQAAGCGPSIDIILRTTDGGVTWRRQAAGASWGLLGVFFTDANTGWAVGERGTILHTTTGGEAQAAVAAQLAGSKE